MTSFVSRDEPLAWLVTLMCTARAPWDCRAERLCLAYAGPAERRADSESRRERALARGVRSVCADRGWRVLFLSVRAGRVRAVVQAGAPAEAVLAALKAGVTHLPGGGPAAQRTSIEVPHGSIHQVWTLADVYRTAGNVPAGGRAAPPGGGSPSPGPDRRWLALGLRGGEGSRPLSGSGNRLASAVVAERTAALACDVAQGRSGRRE